MAPKPAGLTWQEKLASKDPRLEYLDATDRAILDRLGKGETQASIGVAVGKSRQAIWWRIQEMVKLGILEERPTYPRSYRILPEATKLTGAEPCILIHDVGIRMDIQAIGPKYESEKLFLAAKWMRNWWQRSFDHRYVHFDINETKTPNLFFHVTGAGKTTSDAIENARGKALEARDFIEDKLGITLGNPQIDTSKAHVVTLFTSREQFEILGTVWNDRSDPAALFEGQLQQTNADKVVEILKDNNKIRAEMDTIKADMAELKAESMQTALQGFEARMIALDKRLDAIDARFLSLEKVLGRFADTFERIAGV